MRSSMRAWEFVCKWCDFYASCTTICLFFVLLATSEFLISVKCVKFYNDLYSN